MQWWDIEPYTESYSIRKLDGAFGILCTLAPALISMVGLKTLAVAYSPCNEVVELSLPPERIVLGIDEQSSVLCCRGRPPHYLMPLFDLDEKDPIGIASYCVR